MDLHPNRLSTLVTTLALGALLAGCHSPPPDAENARPVAATPAELPTSSPASDDSPAAGSQATTARKKAPQPAAMLGADDDNGSANAPDKLADEPAAAAPAAPTEPPEEPYDLEEDLKERKALAKATFGKKVRLRVVEGVFLAVGATPMNQRDFDRSLWIMRKSTAAYLNDRFGQRPAKAISVYLFPGKRTYNKFCKKHYNGCGTPYGVYFHGDRRIVMNMRPGLGTLTHELVHPFVETDFPNAPEWLNEGIASLFERPSFPKDGEIRGRTNWRLPRLTDAIRSKDKKERERAQLHRVFSMTDNEFRGAHEDLHYSMGRYICQWLDKNGQLWPFYQAYRDNYANDPTGAKAFEEVVGKTPQQANGEWIAWVKRLKLR